MIYLANAAEVLPFSGSFSWSTQISLRIPTLIILSVYNNLELTNRTSHTAEVQKYLLHELEL